MTDRTINKISELQKETQTLYMYNNMVPLHLNEKLPKLKLSDITLSVKC